MQRLLAFARKQPLDPVRGEPERDRARHAGPAAIHDRACRAEWRRRWPRDLWPALVDPVQIEHVILNLAINARDAMPEGGVLTITTANLTADSAGRGEDLPAGDYVGVAVTDTGTGMTEDVLRNAFEPFFTTKPPGQGTGLGLSQVYGMASQSGGGVRIDSSLGRGTTVRVLLPRADAHAVFGTGGGDRVPHRCPQLGAAEGRLNGTSNRLTDRNAVSAPKSHRWRRQNGLCSPAHFNGIWNG